MRIFLLKQLTFTLVLLLIASTSLIVIPSDQVSAGSHSGEDLALAILADQSTLIASDYWDRDQEGARQAIVLSSLGTLIPTNGPTFIFMSTGVAGAVPVTTDALNPGSERGTFFRNKYGQPRDEAVLTLTLQVPDGMHYLYYDVQFFSSEYPEYLGSQYNDKLTVMVDSPSQGITEYICDVNSGDFILDSIDIPGTGFNIFAQSGNPEIVDWVDTTPRIPGADAGATALVTRQHPVKPHEQITVTFDIKDIGDNQFDSAAFIDNLMFSGYEKPEVFARKTANDLNGGLVQCGDTIEYSITISNIGGAIQGNNPGNEFEDIIPENTTYVPGSISTTSGTIDYVEGENKIVWNGEIPGESSVALEFQVTINEGLSLGYIISNQGTVYWDSNENGTNDAIELTDDPSVNDGIDQDGDGETGDDDPTELVVFVNEPPSLLTEDFSDDLPDGNATQLFYGYKWFETSDRITGSYFEVASSYHYSTPRSFKTKVRSSGSPLYWNYYLKGLNCTVDWWEIWFACGNASESSDLILDFKNDDENSIARIKFEYVHEGYDPITDYIVKLYYWKPSVGWRQLRSDFPSGYLDYDWYKLRIAKNGSTNIDYQLYRNGVGLVDSKTDGTLGSPFANLERIEWSNTLDSVVCPMFFWDEHIIGLSEIT